MGLKTELLGCVNLNQKRVRADSDLKKVVLVNKEKSILKFLKKN